MLATTQLNTESVLLKSIADGDEQAFKLLYDQNFDRIAKYTYKMCKSEAITEEIVQDVFLKLWLNRSALTEVQYIQAYLFSIARNKTIDFLRRLARETNIMETLVTQQAAPRYVADDQLNEDALLMLINQALNSLCMQKRKIFELSKLQGFSHDEIAAKLRLSKSTVKNHLSETLRHLKTHILHNPKNGFFLVLYCLGKILLKN